MFQIKVLSSADILQKNLGCTLLIKPIKIINELEFLLKLYHWATEPLYKEQEKN